MAPCFNMHFFNNWGIECFLHMYLGHLNCRFYVFFIYIYFHIIYVYVCVLLMICLHCHKTKGTVISL